MDPVRKLDLQISVGPVLSVLDPFRTDSKTVPCKKAYPIRFSDRIRLEPEWIRSRVNIALQFQFWIRSGPVLGRSHVKRSRSGPVRFRTVCRFRPGPVY